MIFLPCLMFVKSQKSIAFTYRVANRFPLSQGQANKTHNARATAVKGLTLVSHEWYGVVIVLKLVRDLKDHLHFRAAPRTVCHLPGCASSSLPLQRAACRRSRQTVQLFSLLLFSVRVFCSLHLSQTRLCTCWCRILSITAWDNYG